MIRANDLEEINALGEQEEEEQALWEDELEAESGGKRYSLVPVLQMAACALALLALLYVRFADEEVYRSVVAWYQTESQKEVELPSFSEKKPSASSASESEVEKQPESPQALERI